MKGHKTNLLFSYLGLGALHVVFICLLLYTQVVAQTPSSSSRNSSGKDTTTQREGAKFDRQMESHISSPPGGNNSDDLMIKDIFRKFRETYRLGPADELAIRVKGQPDYTVERVKVSPGGVIYHPLLGEIIVAGLTIEQLKRQLTTLLNEYILDPVVGVELLDAASAKYGIIGEVKQPGIYVMTRPTTVLDAVTAAGGISEYGKNNNITLLRHPLDGNPQTITVDLKRVYEGKARPEDNVVLIAGDTLIVHGNTMKVISKVTQLAALGSLIYFMASSGVK